MNKKYKKYMPLVSLLFIPFLVLLYLDYRSANNNAYELQISNNFIKKFNLEDVSYGQDFKAFNGRYEDVILKIKVLNNLDFNQSMDYISGKIFLINSIYRNMDSPYPGHLSNIIKCEEEFKPRTIENSPFDYYILYASDRFIYGACSLDLIRYTSMLYYIHCNETDELYQIELFVPLYKKLSEYEKSLISVSC
ncbi:hypothetical protein HYU09_02620 [Candidatus Woesearchaeota archaeon]|nr:hypothetical protein [Candidatus Woesearchaeota archaeon]